MSIRCHPHDVGASLRVEDAVAKVRDDFAHRIECISKDNAIWPAGRAAERSSAYVAAASAHCTAHHCFA
eukprot:4659666-Pyramimonas_sp.AAC.1